MTCSRLLPDIVPPVHVVKPLTVTVSEPVNVPAETVKVVVSTTPPLLKFAVPPLTLNVVVLISSPLLKFAVPPLIVMALPTACTTGRQQLFSCSNAVALKVSIRFS